MLRTLPVHAKPVLITARVSTLGPNWRYRLPLLRSGCRVLCSLPEDSNGVQ